MASSDLDIVTDPTTLAPLTGIPHLHRGLIAVTFFGLLSLFTSLYLFFRLLWRLSTWSRRAESATSNARIHQFVVLLTNLVFADIQQSCAFWLNAHWLAINSITVSTPTCWAQGWFVSTGDLGSGLFTLAIAVHAFGDIIYDFRLSSRAFYASIAGLWTFNYALAILGIAMHPSDFYARAGAWCWTNTKYTDERLYLHYLWVITSEFGTVIIYAAIFIILQRRVRSSFYASSATAARARSAAKAIIAYPIVYVVCTLPLVKARLTSMAGKPVTFVELTVAGAMITSNGWLDVLLYTLTRSSSIFSPSPRKSPSHSPSASDQAFVPGGVGGVLDTFRHRPDQAFGTTTVIEASRGVKRSLSKKRSASQSGFASWSGSTEELWTASTTTPAGGEGKAGIMQGVKADTTVVVRTDAVEMDPLRRSRHAGAGEAEMGLGREEVESVGGRSGRSRLKMFGR